MKLLFIISLNYNHMDVISKHSTSEHPTMSPLFVGTTFKVLEVAGLAGVSMPLHYSTGEAVISVKSGEALLEIDDYQHFLKSGDTFLIPAMKVHSLAILDDFKAMVVMPVDSEIKFSAQ